MNIRRTIGFAVTVLVVGRLCYQIAWEPELRDRLVESPWQSVGLMALAVVSTVLLLWAIFDPSQWRTLMAFCLGAATVLWGKDLLQGISWSQLGILLGITAGLALAWFITTWDRITVRGHVI